ncbi:MAG: type II toxin-antitoxin system RelB/DinJ family antitoxin [Synergistaceae bacterium]|nr:type II toxin-antitoxin system RelB/DinJ family antitoxin [Synergistaceae bacterium]
MKDKNRKTATITLRVAPQMKDDLEYLFETLGTSISGACNMFFAKALSTGSIPFDLISKEFNPDFNEETIEALQETIDINSGKIPAKRYHSAQELFEANNAEIAASNA